MTRTETTSDGTEWLVADLTLLKPMDLDGGYVPRRHVRASAPKWDGVPLTNGHPRKGDRLISANSSTEVIESTWRGFVMNTRFDGTFVQGQAWFPKDRMFSRLVANDVGGGDEVSVSPGYHYRPLQSGVYDGQYHKQVAGNLRPDHVAVLRDREGICSVDDGCRVAANELVVHG